MSDTSQQHITIRPPITFYPAMGVRARGPHALTRMPSLDDSNASQSVVAAVATTEPVTLEGIRILPFIGRRL